MESILHCDICYQVHDENDHKPMSLPCGHTMCFTCVSKMFQSDSPRCPFDKKPVTIQLDQVPVNYSILKALDLNESENEQRFCQDHPQKQIEFYCKTDKVYICSKCVLQHASKQHEVIECSVSWFGMREKLATVHDDFIQLRNQTSPSDNTFNQLERELKVKVQNQIDRLNASYDRVIEQFESQRYNLTNLIEESAQNQLRELDARREKCQELDNKIEESITELKEAIEDFETCDVQDTDYEHLLNTKKMELKSVTMQKPTTIPKKEFRLLSFKNSIKIGDYGSVQETTYTLNHVSTRRPSSGMMYIFGDDYLSRTLLKFNLDTHEWYDDELPESSTSKFRQCCAAVALDSDSILMVGGGAAATREVKMFDVRDNTFSARSPLTEPRSAHAVVKCGEYVYAIGGFTGKQRISTMERYSPTKDVWVPMPSMKHKRHYLCACAMNDTSIYVVGGFYGSGDIDINETIEHFNVTTKKWTQLDVKLKKPLWASTVHAVSPNEICILGGKYTNRINEVNLLNVNTQKWTPMPQMKQMRVSHKSCVYKDQLFVFGGDYTFTCEVFDFKKKEWSYINSYSTLIENSLYSFSSAEMITDQTPYESDRNCEPSSLYDDQLLSQANTARRTNCE